MTKQIELTQGKVTVVDDEHYEYLSRWKWHAHKRGNKFYAQRTEGWLNPKKIQMHRVITNAPSGMDVDHRDGDGLNNQIENLRVCTRTQNQSNREKQANNTSGYKGVKKAGIRWRAQIQVSGKTIDLGTWSEPEEAAKAYDKAARKYHGDFAKTNF